MSLLKKYNDVGLARNQIKIRYAKDGVIALSDGKYRAVIKTSAVNFGLKAEAEQDALIDIFQNLLNSLRHPVQILIRTRKMDVERYINRLEELEKREEEPLYKIQLESYRKFIRRKIEVSNILSRKFYVVVPYDFDRKQISNRSGVSTVSEESVFNIAKEQLKAHSANLIEQLKKLGVRAEQLTTDEVLELFYTFFNPGESIGKTLKRRLKEEELSYHLQVHT